MYRGSKFILLMGDGNAPEAFTQVAGVKSNGLSYVSKFSETTDTGKNTWKQLVSARGKSATLSLSGNFNDSDTLAALQALALSGMPANFRMQEESGSYWYGLFFIESLSHDGSVGKNETYTVKMISSGTIKRVIMEPDDGPFRITDIDLFVRATDDGADRIYE